MSAEPEPHEPRPTLRLLPDSRTLALSPVYAAIREIAERLRNEQQSGDELKPRT